LANEAADDANEANCANDADLAKKEQCDRWGCFNQCV
jgi:hypothetical protein